MSSAAPPPPPAPSDWAAPPQRGAERRVWIGLGGAVALLVGLVAVAVGVLAGAQAYVRAEGFYVKGLLEAAHHVRRAAETGDPAEVAAARRALRRPQAYGALRRAMSGPERDAGAARARLVEIGHSPGEARSMVGLFPVVRRLPALAPSLDAWVRADRLTARLATLADRTGRATSAGGAGTAGALALADEAARTAARAGALGVAFSDTLAAGTRTVRWGLVGVALGLGLVIVALGGGAVVRALRRVQAADGRYRHIVQHGTDIVTVLDPAGTVLYESPSIQAALGFLPEDRVGRSAFDFVHPGDREAIGAHFASALGRGGVAEPGRFRFARADGGWATLEAVAVSHLDDPAVRAVVVNSRDVSDRVRAEAEHAARVEAEAAQRAAEATAALAAEAQARAEEAQAAAEDARARAEELLRLKASFLSNMSHELRTPLTAILGFAEILAEDAAPPDQEFALAIYRGGLRLRDSLESVLDHAQLEAGRVEITAERVDVVARVAAAVDRLRPLADERGLALLAPTDPAVWTPVDVGALDRVVAHLVGNALKFTDAGCVSVSVRRVGTAEVEVAVADTGVGMTPAELGRVFNAFEQASEGDDRRYEGAGLGLSITRQLVTLMGGAVGAESVPGGGSTFRVRLPAAPQRTSDRARPAPRLRVEHAQAA